MRCAHALAFAALLLGAGVAEAQPRPGQIILAGCRQGECGWLRIVSIQPAARVPEGALVRMVARRGSSLHPDGNPAERARDARIDWARRDQVDYAFCSTQRPAFAFETQDSGLIVHFLDLFDLGGYQYGSAGLYMRLCHGRDGVPSEAVLRRLGYRPGTRSEQVENGTPETMTRF